MDPSDILGEPGYDKYPVSRAEALESFLIDFSSPRSRKRRSRFLTAAVALVTIVGAFVSLAPIAASVFPAIAKVEAAQKAFNAVELPANLEEVTFFATSAGDVILVRDGDILREVELACIDDSQAAREFVEAALASGERIWLEKSSSAERYYVWLSASPETAGSCLTFAALSQSEIEGFVLKDQQRDIVSMLTGGLDAYTR